MQYLVFCIALALSLLAPLRAQTPAETDDDLLIEIMDPETVYSFRGIDGRGFLLRSPVNLPLPFYTGSETGIVALRFVITPAGTVSRATQETDIYATATADMIRAAHEAVMRWEFNTLPARAPQVDEEVRVVIQFNDPASGVRYSVDGCVTIEGLGARNPLRLPAPVYATRHEGVVTALLTLAPEGHIAWIDEFYGLHPGHTVTPKLGIITHTALRQWRFAAREAVPPGPQSRSEEPDPDDPFQQVKVTFRYIRWE